MDIVIPVHHLIPYFPIVFIMFLYCIVFVQQIIPNSICLLLNLCISNSILISNLMVTPRIALHSILWLKFWICVSRQFDWKCICVYTKLYTGWYINTNMGDVHQQNSYICVVNDPYRLYIMLSLMATLNCAFHQIENGPITIALMIAIAVYDSTECLLNKNVPSLFLALSLFVFLMVIIFIYINMVLCALLLS